MLNLRVAAAALAVTAGLWAAVSAAGPTFWTVGTQSDFLKGDVQDLSIDSDGRLLLGPSASVIADTAAPFLWTLNIDKDGTIWTGSGNEGKLLRVGKDGKVSTFFDSGELEVHAVAPGPDGGMYVGTSPDGRIYYVSSSGASRAFFDPDDKYIWSLAVDRAGNVFAATGDKGVIYRITPDGKGAPFYRTNATNAVTLAFTKDGELLAGTEAPGRVFRIDSAGKAFVLLDSPYREIHGLEVADDGTIYAVAVNGSGAGERASEPPPVSESPRPPVATVSAEITGVSAVDPTSGSAGASPITSPRSSPRRSGRGGIYRIRTDGLWDLMWDSGEDAPFDVAIEPGGSLLVGTGTDGKIFRLAGEPARPTLLARAGARQVTALVREPSGRVVGVASNPGKLFALAPQPSKRGSYESDIRDAGTVATWGVIRWRAALNGGNIEVSTRSGNTSTPDETWSAWSKGYTNATGEQIASPNARYLQWRITMNAGASGSPVLTSVTAAYLPRNLRPVVASITVHPAGTVFQRPFPTGDPEIAGYPEGTVENRNPATADRPPSPALGRRFYQKGLQTFAWKADDGNDDRLHYDVLYRREGDVTWRALQRGLTDPIFVWDTSSVPDGTYIVKVVATDAPSNAPATALAGEMESASFDIDNTPPRIEVQPTVKPGSRTTLTFVVRDEQSAVQKVEYSLDASRWRVAHPRDGIADSRREEFEIGLADGETGGNVIIRVTDAMNNVATATAEIRR